MKLDLRREDNRSCHRSCKNSHAFSTDLMPLSTDVSEIKNEVTTQLWSDETKGESLKFKTSLKAKK